MIGPNVCLILVIAGNTLLPVDKAFPDYASCEKAGQEITDGQTVKGAMCMPGIMVDGLPTYDCNYQRNKMLGPAPDPHPDPKPKKFQGKPLE